jgi:intracellular septation protein A
LERSIVSLSLSWSIFWRVLAVEFLLAAVTLLVIKDTALLTDPALAVWKLSIIWTLFACVLAVGQLSLSKGVLHLLWGSRLGRDEQFWRGIGYGAAGFGVLIALLNLVVGSLVPFALWVNLKTFGPLLLLGVFAVASPLWVKKRSNLSLQRTATPPAEL